MNLFIAKSDRMNKELNKIYRFLATVSTMIKKFFAQINLNTKTMFKYGFIAWTSMATIFLFFNTDNAMLAFPIALTAIALSFENIQINTLRKIISLIIIDCTIITISYLASKNPYIGIILNFITIFIIANTLTLKFNPKIYKPFIMLFVFTSFSKVQHLDYIKRLEAAIFGIIFVILISLISLRKENKRLISNVLNSPLNILLEQIKSINTTGFNLSLCRSLSTEMENLCYKVYISRYRKYLMTKLSEFQFNIFLSLERFNILLKEFSCSNSFNPNFFKDLEIFLAFFKDAISKNHYTNDLSNAFLEFKSKYNTEDFKEILDILDNVILNTLEFSKLSSRQLNRVDKSTKRSELDTLRSHFKSNLSFNSVRFRFSFRIALALTIIIFLGHIISLYKFIWVAITVMSVMQPYYEDTVSHGKGRIKGNIIGASFVIILLSLSHNRDIAFITLSIALFLTYGFKEYYKLSLFTSIASISVASLSTGLREITLSRIIFIIIGVFVVILFNKFILPYDAKRGAKALIYKLLNYNKLLIFEVYNSNSKESYATYNRVQDIIILSILTAKKLIARNSMLKDKNLTKTSDLNKNLNIKLGYDFLKKLKVL